MDVLKRGKNHVYSKFTLSDSVEGLSIVYEERVSTSPNIVALARAKMRAEHRAVLESLVDRIESEEEVVVEPTFKNSLLYLERS